MKSELKIGGSSGVRCVCQTETHLIEFRTNDHGATFSYPFFSSIFLFSFWRVN